MISQFPNKRGAAQRSNNKGVRVATHIPLIKFVISARRSDISTVIEHGMGIGSTPFFHSLSHVSMIFSFENDPAWRSCASCQSDTKQHAVIGWPGNDPLSVIPGIETDSTFALVDGPCDERFPFLLSCLSRGISSIVEHDSETFSSSDVEIRRKACLEFGYRGYQWINDDPESVIYTRDHLSHASLVTL